MQYSTAQFRKNLKIEIDGEPFTIVDFQHVKPGKASWMRLPFNSLRSDQNIKPRIPLPGFLPAEEMGGNRRWRGELRYRDPKPLAETGPVTTLQNSNRTWAATVSRPPSARMRITARLATLCWSAAGLARYRRTLVSSRQVTIDRTSSRDGSLRAAARGLREDWRSTHRATQYAGMGWWRPTIPRQRKVRDAG